jgi:ribosome biogenesis GTPase / thiamine phosphate phosphatase
MNLAAWGWSEHFSGLFREYEREGLVPARVVVEHHGFYELVGADGELGGVPSGRLKVYGEEPAVGDWVAVEPLDGERKAVIRAVLPRRTKFVRKEPWRRTVVQVVAANVDGIFLVAGLDGDFNVRRLERYLTAAWESGAEPVVVLTKRDLDVDWEERLAEAEAVSFGVPVRAVSNVTGDGLDELEAAYLRPGRTVALLGSSGVGKSTLANRLLGREALKTAGLRADGKGRHTTTRRQLVRLPGGGLLLDTPGLRELQLWAREDSLDETFADVAELAAECRFRDCSHESEPGCAVRTALEDGTLAQERWDSHRRLQRELRALAIRQDQRLRAEAKQRWRRFERDRRARGRRGA